MVKPVVLYGCETWSHTLWEEHRLRVKLSSYLNKEVTVRFGKLKMQLWDSMC
jgi:hypothetical protein